MITLQDIFLARAVSDRAAAQSSPSFLRPLECTGLQPHFQHKLAGHGVILAEDFYQPDPAPGRLGERELPMTSLLFDSAVGPLVVGLAVGCLMLVATLVALAKPRGAWLKSRLEPYGGAGGAVAAGGPARTSGRAGWRPQVDRLYGATERALDRTSAWGSLERLIERAHLQVRPAQLLFWSAAAGIAAAAVAGLLTSSTLLVDGGLAAGNRDTLRVGQREGPPRGCGRSRSSFRTC